MNRWSPETQTLLFLVLDEKPITLDIIGKGPTTFEMHPKFRLIGFSNDDVRTFPSGLIRRLESKVSVNDLAPGLWKQIPKQLHDLVRSSAFLEDDEKRITGAEWEIISAVTIRTGSFHAALALIVGEERSAEISAQFKTMSSTAER
jgi:MoxR-like ATPase